ncbi:hypothetical protein Bmul_2040 [Burkholderia multivorans ATCC 17616]|nr:hypothetical protein Bmul_2040 [Burkholderia multivorans ATCC 17616]
MGEFAAGVCAFRVPAGVASRAACAASSVTARRYRGRRCRSYRSVARKSIGALDSASDRCFSISAKPADLGFEHKAASVSRDFDRCRAVGPGAKARRRPLPTRVRRRALIRLRSTISIDWPNRSGRLLPDTMDRRTHAHARRSYRPHSQAFTIPPIADCSQRLTSDFAFAPFIRRSLVPRIHSIESRVA